MTAGAVALLLGSLIGGPATALELPPIPGERIHRQAAAPLVRDAAKRHGVDAALIHAVIAAESAYDPDALSSRGAIGVMQLMPDTAAALGVDPYDTAENIDGGTRLLKTLLGRYRNIQIALAAYNAGDAAVLRGRRSIPRYPETQRFVVRVLHYYMRFKREPLD